MATVVQTLAAWATSVTTADLPKTVLDRAKLQHLHLATLVSRAPQSGPWDGLQRLAPRRGPALLAGGRRSSVHAAARVHSAQAAWTDRLDHMLGGPTGVGAVTAAWGASKGSSFGDLLTATVVANEVAGRIGAALMLGPHYGAGAGWVYASSGAISSGRLLGLDAEQMAHALAIAVSSTGVIPRSVTAGSGRAMAVSIAVSAGVEAARLAKAGVRGPINILDAAGGLLESGCWLPLPHAFTGLGKAWLTETLSFPRWPGPPAWHATLDALNEVLRRHVKAADKRLRADQVRAIRVSVPAPAVALERWMGRHGLRDSESLGHAVRHAIGALVVEHQLGEAEISGNDWAERSERYGDIAGRVTVTHDLGLTMDLIANTVQTAAPLVGGITETEWWTLARRLEGAEAGWPALGLDGVRSLLKHRPDKWMRAVRYAPRDLADAHLSDWQPRMGASVVVDTTRGGSWPEVRVNAECGPGSSWNGLIGEVMSGFSAESADRQTAAAEIWDAPFTQQAEGIVERLIY